MILYLHAPLEHYRVSNNTFSCRISNSEMQVFRKLPVFQQAPLEQWIPTAKVFRIYHKSTHTALKQRLSLCQLDEHFDTAIASAAISEEGWNY